MKKVIGSKNKASLTTEGKIKTLVEEYKMLFPEEYIFVANKVREKRENLANEFGDMRKRGTKFLERPLTEIPEKLDTAIFKALDEDEKNWWYTIKAQYWFARMYPEFRVTGEI